MNENLLIPVFNSNELNTIYKRRGGCRPDTSKYSEFQAIKYLTKLELYSVSLYSVDDSGHQKFGEINHQKGSIICPLDSNDIFDPAITFEEFYEKNGYKYDRFNSKDYMRDLYDNYMRNPLIEKIFKSPGYKREISLHLSLD